MEKTKVYGIEITNKDKIIYKKITKLDVINYYKNISTILMPFIKDRYVSQIRCHNGFKTCFFKKHPNNDNKHLINISSKRDLIKEIQLGTIEIHPYANKIINKFPDIMIFDLDPDENLSLKKLRDGVKLLKAFLDSLNLTSFLKTSGGKGYHVVIPFLKTKNFKSFENFAKQVAMVLEKNHPNYFTTSIKKSERKNKIFIDFLRNKKGATCVSVYSLRARDNLPISFPLSWSELYKIKPNEINISNYKKHLKKDFWKNFFKVTQELN